MTREPINVRIGEGRTAEVLRNLCYLIYEEGPESWTNLVARIRSLFGCELDPPRYVAERGEILMTYREQGVQLDLSSSGRWAAADTAPAGLHVRELRLDPLAGRA